MLYEVALDYPGDIETLISDNQPDSTPNNDSNEDSNSQQPQNSNRYYWQLAISFFFVASYIAPIIFLDKHRKKFDGSNEKDVIATILFCAALLTTFTMSSQVLSNLANHAIKTSKAKKMIFQKMKI